MGKLRSDPLKAVAFVCPACPHSFEAEAGRVESDPDLVHHPHVYFADCPLCGGESTQAQWQKNLLKAWAHATGPKTPEGKAASIANLDGHPTPEEAKLTRFNAVKHNLFSKISKFLPARPGKYPRCTGCEHLEDESCVPHRACLKQAETFLKHHVAFETGDPSLLTEMRADTHAMLQSLIEDMLITIAADGGPRLKSPEWFSDKDGGFHLARFMDEDTGEFVQIEKLEAHPLMKPLIEFVSKLGMTLSDLEMTPKSRDDTDALKGYLDNKHADEVTALEHTQKQTLLLESLRDQISKSQDQMSKDPLLIEHGEAVHD